MRRGSNNANRSNNKSAYKRREREKLGTQVLILPICKISMIVVEIDSFAGRDSKLTNKTVNVAELV